MKYTSPLARARKKSYNQCETAVVSPYAVLTKSMPNASPKQSYRSALPAGSSFGLVTLSRPESWVEKLFRAFPVVFGCVWLCPVIQDQQIRPVRSDFGPISDRFSLRNLKGGSVWFRLVPFGSFFDVALVACRG